MNIYSAWYIADHAYRECMCCNIMKFVHMLSHFHAVYSPIIASSQSLSFERFSIVVEISIYMIKIYFLDIKAP